MAQTPLFSRVIPFILLEVKKIIKRESLQKLGFRQFRISLQGGKITAGFQADMRGESGQQAMRGSLRCVEKKNKMNWREITTMPLGKGKRRVLTSPSRWVHKEKGGGTLSKNGLQHDLTYSNWTFFLT